MIKLFCYIEDYSNNEMMNIKINMLRAKSIVNI